jgi:hypothetical protein
VSNSEWLLDRTVCTCRPDFVRFLFVSLDKERSLRKKEGCTRRIARSHFGCFWPHKETWTSSQTKNTLSSHRNCKVRWGWRWDFLIYTIFWTVKKWLFLWNQFVIQTFFLSFFLSPTSFYLTLVRCRGVIAFDHTQGHTTVGRTPLEDGSARRRDSYLTTHNTQNKQTTTLLEEFEPATPASNRPQTLALDRSATGIGCLSSIKLKLQ